VSSQQSCRQKRKENPSSEDPTGAGASYKQLVLWKKSNLRQKIWVPRSKHTHYGEKAQVNSWEPSKLVGTETQVHGTQDYKGAGYRQELLIWSEWFLGCHEPYFQRGMNSVGREWRVGGSLSDLDITTGQVERLPWIHRLRKDPKWTGILGVTCHLKPGVELWPTCTLSGFLLCWGHWDQVLQMLGECSANKLHPQSRQPSLV
jgi:hypothetical protein